MYYVHIYILCIYNVRNVYIYIYICCVYIYILCIYIYILRIYTIYYVYIYIHTHNILCIYIYIYVYIIIMCIYIYISLNYSPNFRLMALFEQSMAVKIFKSIAGCHHVPHENSHDWGQSY